VAFVALLLVPGWTLGAQVGGVPATGMVRATRAILDTFSLDVAMPADTGQCLVMMMMPQRTRNVSVYYPSTRDFTAATMVTVDSTGRVVRYSDSRGLRRPLSISSFTLEQRDSAARAARAEYRATSILVDFGSGVAVAMNLGGGRPDNGISTQLDDIGSDERYGAPVRRAAAIVQRCGIVPRAMRAPQYGLAPGPYFEFQVEKQVKVLSGMPQYPDALKSAHISGEVLAQFVVDEHGAFVPGSFHVLKTNNDLFSDAVRAAVSAAVFSPAERAGVKVAQLVQMPFVFNWQP
jgi:TonB family protein